MIKIVKDECKCSLRQRALGDGCRYCNPQLFIDMLLEELEELREMEEWMEENSNTSLHDWYNRDD